MTLNQDAYAIVLPDGTVAGDGDGQSLYHSREAAVDEIDIAGKIPASIERL